MSPRSLHDWDLSPTEAVQKQRELAHLVRIEPLSRKIETIGGADVSFNKFSRDIYAGIVILRLANLEILESSGVRTTAEFPYLPGLLSFREIPALLEAWDRLKIKPDLLMLDGQGLAHPRRFGIACHAGVLLDLPTIGCAKSILVGKHGELPIEAGSQSPLVHRDQIVGMALRTRKNVAPVYVSPGHLIDLDGAVKLTLESTSKYRQPDPTRQAHLLVNRLRTGDGG